MQDVDPVLVCKVVEEVASCLVEKKLTIYLAYLLIISVVYCHKPFLQ